MELKHSSLGLKQRLGESETVRMALESDKLRLSIQNITHSPRGEIPVMTSSPKVTSAVLQEGRVSIGNACNDITEVSNS